MTNQHLIRQAIDAGLITIKSSGPIKIGRPIIHHDYTHVKQRMCMARLRAARKEMKEGKDAA